MSQSILSEKYSKALFESVSKEQVSSVFSELDQLTKCFGEEATKLFFSNPFVSLDNKLMVAKSSLEGRCSHVVFNFLVLLVTNGRLHLLEEFVTAYQRLSNVSAGLIEGTLLSAGPVSKEFLGDVEAKLSLSLNKKVKLINKEDKNLVSGYRVSVGGFTIDDSFQFHINKIKEDLLKRG